MKSKESYRADNENITKICFQKDKYFMSAYIWKLFKIQKTLIWKLGLQNKDGRKSFFSYYNFFTVWNFCIYIYIYMCVLLFKFKILKN